MHGYRLSRLLLVAASLLWASPVLAKGAVAVLTFGGDPDGSIRNEVVAGLSEYTIIHGDLVLDACDQLGIPMSAGRNLARCAAKAGASAVVGAAVGDGSLNAMVFSGKTGQVVAKASVPCEDRLSRANQRKLVALLKRGLKKAGAEPGKASAAPASDGGGYSFEPEPVDKSNQRDDSDEDPIAGTGTPSFDPDAPATPAPEPSPSAEAAEPTETESTGWPRIELDVGLGTWMRNFSLNDPASTSILPQTSCPEAASNPVYGSGATFALRLGAKARPLAFLSDGFLSFIYLRLQFQTTVGLNSMTSEYERDTTSGSSTEGCRVKGTDGKYKYQVKEGLGTSFWELLMDLGLDWDILKTPTSPHLVGGLGFGLMRFSIDWDTEMKKVYDTQSRIPDVAYTFVLLKLGLYWPFLSLMGGDLSAGGHFNFDYRPVVGDAGDVEDPTFWYGPASIGGINLGIGVDGRYHFSEKLNLRFGVEYTYTRYFYSFEDPELRVKPNQRAAGGALDILHGILIHVGYAY